MSTTIHTPKEPSASPQTDGKHLRDIHLRDADGYTTKEPSASSQTDGKHLRDIHLRDADGYNEDRYNEREPSASPRTGKDSIRRPLLRDKIASLLFLLLCSVPFLTGCTRHNGVTFVGDITGADGCYLTISRTCADETLFTDSVQIRNGSFSMTVPAGDDGPDFYLVSLHKDNAFTTLASKGETVRIEADASSLARTYRATGSPDAERMWQLDRRLALFADSTDQLEELYYYYQEDDSMRAQIEAVYMKIRENHTAFLRNFIAENSESISCLAAFYQRYNRHRFFSEKENLQLLQDICTSLKSRYPDNGNVIWLEDRIEKIKGQ